MRRVAATQRGRREARKPAPDNSPQGDAREGDTVRPRRDGEVAQRPSGKQRFERKFGGKPLAVATANERRQGRRTAQGQVQWSGCRPERRSRRWQAKSWTTQKPREDRPVRVDPDSPFAKLAALRDQLKK